MKRYEKYKQSGIDWIGEVPEHWEVTRCRFISRLLHGMSYTPKDVVSEGEGTLVLRASNIQDSKLAFDDNVFIPSEMIPAQKMTRKGDIVICSTNGSLALCGKSALVKEDGLNLSFGSFMMVMRTDQNPIFIQYQLSQMVDLYRGLFATTTINQLTMDMLKDFSFILPPLAEQEAIAAYLDARCADIDKVVATQQKRIALLQELKQSEITKAVTRGLNPDARMKDSGVEWIGMVPEEWEVRRIRHLVKDDGDSIKIGPFGSSLTGKVIADGAYKVYGQWNIIGKDFTAGLNTVTEETFNNLINYQIIENDILISMMGTVGKCATIPKGIQKGIMDSHVIKIRLNQSIMRSDFFEYVYDKDNSSIVYSQIQEIKKGSIMDGLNSSLLKDFKLPVPSVEEQTEIVEYLDRRCGEIDKQIGAVTKQIELLREYKQALITEVVTGKRKVC